jgi:DnaJ-class molecular chaperone
MDYSQNVNKQASTAGLAKQQGSSEALQDLIDILKQKYVSDCQNCSGTGINLKNHACEFCQGRGKNSR